MPSLMKVAAISLALFISANTSVSNLIYAQILRSHLVHDPRQWAALSLLSPDKRLGTPQSLVSEVLAWLPADTETIIGVNGPFPASDFGAPFDNNSWQREPLPKELDLQMEGFALGLFGLKNGGLQGFLKGKTVAVAVEGSRTFRPPKGLGGMLYEGCEIAVLDGAVTLDRDSFMKNAAGSAKRFEKVEDTTIAVFEQRQEQDVWTTFVGLPRNDIVLVATDEAYLRTVLARMRGAGGPRALPQTLPEWNYINTRAPAWGLRHYQKRGAALDPTSPYQGKAAANIPDNGAIGITFWFEPFDRKLANLIYLSTNGNAHQILQDYFNFPGPDTGFQIHLRQRAPSVIEGSVVLPTGGAFYVLLLRLNAMLGHAVYL